MSTRFGHLLSGNGNATSHSPSTNRSSPQNVGAAPPDTTSTTTRTPTGLRRPPGTEPIVARSGFRGQGSFETTVQYNDEQKAIIDSRSKLIVANAFAGTGKTTTTVGFAIKNKDARILYMPFGKSVQLEAQRRFPPNTVCQTINSLAFQANHRFKPKLVQSWPALLVRNEMSLQTNRKAGLVHNILNQFMTSGDLDISLSHAESAIERWKASDEEVQESIAVARLAWQRMRDPSDKMPISHDAFLKIWALSNPRLDYDAIILDEAQDTNPVTAGIVKQQTHATRLYIGDRHQSIYRFRGAANAMEEMSQDRSAEVFNLSKTWRFGPGIAALANMLLHEIKGEKVRIIGQGQDSAWRTDVPFTKLSRTNAQLFREAAARRGEGVHWIGKNGILDYNVDRILQAYSMFKDSMGDVTDPILRSFRSWSEAQAYAEDAQDPEVGILIKLVEEFRDETPALVDALKANEVRSPADADLVLTTGHKSKGLEWDYVEICEDFDFLEDLEKKLAEDPYAPFNDQEINLLYVTATRAKKALNLNPDTRRWLKELPNHRAVRNEAKARIDARRDASQAQLRQKT